MAGKSQPLWKHSRCYPILFVCQIILVVAMYLFWSNNIKDWSASGDESDHPRSKMKEAYRTGESANLRHKMKINTKDATIMEIPSFDPNRIKGQYKKWHTDDARHDKWIVITSVAPPTEDVKFLATMPGWKVLVVGDTKTPEDWSYPNCVFLSVSKQRELGLSMEPQLPYNSYARKNVGYLYAIAHGAQVIYETDDVTRPLDKLQIFEFEQTSPGLMFAGKDLFNPFRHFGQPTLWPRGYPLSKIGANNTSVYRFHHRWSRPVIQQGMNDGDPDMDAIFRMTRKLTLERLDVRFDPAATPVLLPEGVFSPFNSQNTLFLKEAFWGLFIPMTVTFRTCDIWRGYWTQRLLWEIDGYLGYYPPNVFRKRNTHNDLLDYELESFMYLNIERLLAFLKQWNCPVTMTFFQCAYRLSVDMATEGFWEEGDVKITKLWLEDLIRIGYSEPKRKTISSQYNLLFKPEMDSLNNTHADDHRDVLISDLEKRRRVTLNQGSVVIFTAAIQTPSTIYPNSTFNLSTSKRHAESNAKIICPDICVKSAPRQAINKIPDGPFDDILLVIIFNIPHYRNIRYTEAIYRPLFPNIIYCGSNSTLFKK